MKNIYLFSGLGADKRAFQALDFSGFNPVFIDWIAANKDETIEDYCTRLIDQINSEKPILVGLSFGGMVAIEVAKQIKTEKVILIASAKTKAEIPLYYRLLGKLRLHQLIPTKILMTPTFITYWFFGVKTVGEKQLLKGILNDTDPKFLKWAIDKILHWQNQTIHDDVFHIHGTADKILPIRYVNPNKVIKDGGHLLTLNRTTELNKTLRHLFNQKD